MFWGLGLERRPAFWIFFFKIVAPQNGGPEGTLGTYRNYKGVIGVLISDYIEMTLGNSTVEAPAVKL